MFIVYRNYTYFIPTTSTQPKLHRSDHEIFFDYDNYRGFHWLIMFLPVSNLVDYNLLQGGGKVRNK